jgi:hypothetical protein
MFDHVRPFLLTPLVGVIGDTLQRVFVFSFYLLDKFIAKMQCWQAGVWRTFGSLIRFHPEMALFPILDGH